MRQDVTKRSDWVVIQVVQGMKSLGDFRREFWGWGLSQTKTKRERSCNGLLHLPRQRHSNPSMATAGWHGPGKRIERTESPRLKTLQRSGDLDEAIADSKIWRVATVADERRVSCNGIYYNELF